MLGPTMYGTRWLFFIAALFCSWIWTMDYSKEVLQSTEQLDCATELVHTWHGWAFLAVIFALFSGITFASKGLSTSAGLP